jgi:mRNA interferase MazF
MSDIRRGDVWQVQCDPALDSEGKGERPAIVMSINMLNKSKMPLATVIPLTSQAPQREGMLNVRIEPSKENGLKKISWAQPHIIRAMNKQQRLLRKRGELSQDDLQRVEDALKMVLGL